MVCLIGASGQRQVDAAALPQPARDRSTTATIWFEGEEITDPRVDARAVRRRMGMVFQAYNLFPHMTRARQHHPGAAQGARRRPRRGRGAGARAARAGSASADKADEHPDRLSGGQQQRAAMVRALATDPSLVLLDEVTSALDPELVGEVLDIVRDLAAGGTTMVLATHEMAFAREVATQVCFLHEGAILEQGPPDRVLGDPTHERTRQFLKRVLGP